jgi:hypothetical protein
MTMTDYYQPTIDNRHSTIRNHQRERQKMTTDTQQRKPANQLSSTKPQFKQLTRNKHQTTANNQHCMHAGKFLENLLVKAVVLFVHEKKGF